MIDLCKIHEREVFDLVGQRTRSLVDVQRMLVAHGFIFEDDFAWVKRTDTIEQWQTESLVHCEFLSRGSEVYPDESEFDSMRFSVLVSALPEEQITLALNVIFDVADGVQLEVSHCSRILSRAAVCSLVSGWSEDVLGETGDSCGSESVAILVLMEYEKRRAS